MHLRRSTLLTSALLVLLAANLVVGILILQRLDRSASAGVTTEQPGRVQARVVRAIDGDTVELETGERVRYLGVDTPESEANANLSSPQFYGPEAAAFNRELVEGRTVWLEADTTETDSYDRLLRWVFLDDGQFVQAELVRNGYAFVNIIGPDNRYADLLRDLERTARAERRGVWTEFQPIAGGSSSEAPTVAAPTATAESAGANLVATFTPTSSATDADTTTPTPAGCTPALVDGAIGPEQTEEVLDRQATVVFEVVGTHNSGNAVFLNSHDPYQGHFYVVIFPDRWEDFPEPPEAYLDGRCIAIAGRVQAYQGTPQIVLRDSIQIEILR